MVKKVQVRIKRGATILHNNKLGKWPVTEKGRMEHVDMIFDGVHKILNGEVLWECTSKGYGSTGHYGHGTITVFDQAVEVV